MTLELYVLTGARAGMRQRWDKALVAVGRHPLSDLRFDAEHDLAVSARHAEIRAVAGHYVVRDLGSTNGTFVNGVGVTGEREIRQGDVITFGESGPRVEVRLAAPEEAAPGAGQPARARQRTTQRVAAAVQRKTRGLRVLLALVTVLLLSGAMGAYWMGHRESQSREAEIAALLRRSDSVSNALTAQVQQMSGRMLGLDSALEVARQQSERLRAQLARERASDEPTDVDALADLVAHAEEDRDRLLAAARLDYTAIAARNNPAVAMIAVELDDGSSIAGTGFAVTPEGEIVTSRHLVLTPQGQAATRVAVLFADTQHWLPAHVLRLSDAADLALLQVDSAGPFPVVAGISRRPRPPVGSPVALVGFPLGPQAAMEGSGTDVIARTTLGVGTVSKVLADLVQVDAYAGEGSSGSPVFDDRGEVVAVVFGGPAASQGRIVYAVPAQRVRALIGN